MHDANGKHTKLVELTDELDKTKTLSLGGGGNVVLVGHELDLSLLAFRLIGQVGFPTTLELLLTAVEQVLAEQSATDNRVASLVLDSFVADLEAHGGQHLVAELGVHTSPVGLVTSLLEGKLDDLAQGAAVSLILRLSSDLKNLLGDLVELLGRHLVERGLHLTLHHVGSHVATGVSDSGVSGTRGQAASDPTVGRLLDGLELLTGGEGHLAGGIIHLPLAGCARVLASTATTAAGLAGRVRTHGGVSTSTHAARSAHAKVARHTATHSTNWTSTCVGGSEALLRSGT